MVFRAGRIGRPGLLGTIARTAVVAGTASATANAVNRRSQQRAAEQQAYAQQQQPQYPPPQPAPAPSEEGLVEKLERLGRLHTSGVLSDQEFAAAKAQLLES
ncbi:SHOCT domain-containing protein [Nocardia mexicana]|uniref:Putative oligomerization/nucleic acid binding protein n=1 Tax=Nocardia mexicana TaxID=279262 RepID=A0A370H1W6_9NOCA|nr:SHOCT domain-containing protein [Nocardia mexicana]RDI49953.1 putative oligomerization/nucleic acid binding protein [Nocardia mexicana]